MVLGPASMTSPAANQGPDTPGAEPTGGKTQKRSLSFLRRKKAAEEPTHQKV